MRLGLVSFVRSGTEQLSEYMCCLVLLRWILHDFWLLSRHSPNIFKLVFHLLRSWQQWRIHGIFHHGLLLPSQLQLINGGWFTQWARCWDPLPFEVGRSCRYGGTKLRRMTQHIYFRVYHCPLLGRRSYLTSNLVYYIFHLVWNNQKCFG